VAEALLEIFKIKPKEKPNNYRFGKGICPLVMCQGDRHKVGQKTSVFIDGAGEVSER